MVARQVRRKKETTEDLDAQVADYLLNRSTRERSGYQEDTYKRRFMALLEEQGVLQEGGHRILMLNEPVVFHSYKAGKMKESEVTGIRRVERSGQTNLNEERTMAYLAKRKLLDACTTTVTVLNEDAILALNFDEKISDEDLAKLYDTSPPTYAFYLVEGDGE
jgi:hypothetical protein